MSESAFRYVEYAEGRGGVRIASPDIRSTAADNDVAGDRGEATISVEDVVDGRQDAAATGSQGDDIGFANTISRVYRCDWTRDMAVGHVNQGKLLCELVSLSCWSP